MADLHGQKPWPALVAVVLLSGCCGDTPEGKPVPGWPNMRYTSPTMCTERSVHSTWDHEYWFDPEPCKLLGVPDWKQ